MRKRVISCVLSVLLLLVQNDGHYVGQLRENNPLSKVMRQNFRKKMDYICQGSFGDRMTIEQKSSFVKYSKRKAYGNQTF